MYIEFVPQYPVHPADPVILSNPPSPLQEGGAKWVQRHPGLCVPGALCGNSPPQIP
jgi:hypothetical protein